MGFIHKCYFSLLSVIKLLPALCYTQDTFTCSRATSYGSPDCLGTPTGACGFGEYGRTVNDANAAGVSRLWKKWNWLWRCKVPQLCTDDGVNIVVTDYGEGDNTDFILSPSAYSRMARPDTFEGLFAYRVVVVEFRRIPCRYSRYNLMFKVHEHSKFPAYLAIVILYQAGQNEILAVGIWQEYCKEGAGMRRAYGAVWDIPNPPKERINLRSQVSASMGLTWVVANDAIPSDWKAGVAYDSQIQPA